MARCHLLILIPFIPFSSLYSFYLLAYFPLFSRGLHVRQSEVSHACNLPALDSPSLSFCFIPCSWVCSAAKSIVSACGDEGMWREGGLLVRRASGR